MDNFKLGQRVRMINSDCTGKIAIIDLDSIKLLCYYMVYDNQSNTTKFASRLDDVLEEMIERYCQEGILDLLSHIPPTSERGLWVAATDLESYELKIGEKVWATNTEDEYTYLKDISLNGSTHLVLTEDDQVLHIADQDLLRSKHTVGITIEELKELGYHIIN